MSFPELCDEGKQSDECCEIVICMWMNGIMFKLFQEFNESFKGSPMLRWLFKKLLEMENGCLDISFFEHLFLYERNEMKKRKEKKTWSAFELFIAADITCTCSNSICCLFLCRPWRSLHCPANEEEEKKDDNCFWNVLTEMNSLSVCWLLINRFFQQSRIEVVQYTLVFNGKSYLDSRRNFCKLIFFEEFLGCLQMKQLILNGKDSVFIDQKGLLLPRDISWAPSTARFCESTSRWAQIDPRGVRALREIAFPSFVTKQNQRQKEKETMGHHNKITIELSFLLEGLIAVPMLMEMNLEWSAQTWMVHEQLGRLYGLPSCSSFFVLLEWNDFWHS